MWQIIFLSVLLAVIAGFMWMSFAVCRFHCISKLVPRKWWKRMLIGALIVICAMVTFNYAMGFVNMVIVFLHLLIVWLLCDTFAWIKRRKTPRQEKHYYAGICTLAFTTVWLGIGWYNAHEVKRTEYNLLTNKKLGIDSLKVVGFSDSHVGATFHWQEFEQYIERINKENPDIVVIIGDYVDDDTSKEDMERSCEALKKLKTKYGVYYVYGNHDEGYWSSNRRGYTIKDLDRRLVQNNVRILRDETVTIAGNILLCGRLDKSYGNHNKPGRKTASSLMANARGKYVICLDHQPNDYTEEANSKMDLVLSGHTHGGQFWGFGNIGVWMGANDAYYGYEHRQNTDFIVSSGIGDWAIDFKTGCISEYIVVNIKNKKN